MASDAATPAEIWALLREIGEKQTATEERLNQSVAVADRWYAAFSASLADLRETIERDRAEFREAMAQSRAEADRRQAEADRRQAEADRRQAEADRRHAETERALGRMARKIGDLGDRIGEFAEALIIPAIEGLLQSQGYEVHGVGRWFKRRFDGRVGEFDYLLVNAMHVVAVEVKSRLTSTDVDEHLQRLRDFKNYFPEYADRSIVGAVAGMVVDDEAAKHAYRKGLYVLEPCGEAVRIRNDGDFKPRIW